MANTILPGGGALAAATQTAGGPSFTNALQMLAGLGGLGGLPNMQGIGYGMGGGYGQSATPSFADNSTLPNGALVDFAPAGAVPGGAATPGLSAAAVPQGTSGSAAPSLADVLAALVGPQPTAPSAAEFGAAPSLADYFNASPYQQALSQLSTGEKNATGTINNAYGQAAKEMAQIAATANGSTNTALGQAKASATDAQNFLNNLAATTEAQSGAGGQMQARMDALKGTLAGQTGAQLALDNQLASVQKNNMAQDQAALTSAKQNNLNFLASQVLGAQNKINLAESQDQARAQQELAAANNSRGAAMAKAGSSYASQLKSYNDAITRYMGLASKALSGSQGGTDWAKSQQEQWSRQAMQGDQNAAALSQAANNLLAPITANGQAKSPTFEQALQRLNVNAGNLGGPQGIEYNLMADWLKNYFGVQKDGAQIFHTATAPSQDQMAQYLYNTYLGG